MDDLQQNNMKPEKNEGRKLNRIAEENEPDDCKSGGDVGINNGQQNGQTAKQTANQQKMMQQKQKKGINQDNSMGSTLKNANESQDKFQNEENMMESELNHNVNFFLF